MTPSAGLWHVLVVGERHGGGIALHGTGSDQRTRWREIILDRTSDALGGTLPFVTGVQESWIEKRQSLEAQ